MSVWVKFCGIVRPEDFEYSIELGVNAVGVIGVPSSPRCLSMQDARELATIARKDALLVLVLQDSDRDSALEMIEALQPDMLQFHGEESVAFAESFGLPFIKATRNADSLGELANYSRAFARMIDSAEEATNMNFESLGHWILAGGLTPENVTRKIHAYQPWGVDVSRGIELEPRAKDYAKMRAFVNAVRKAVE